MNYKFIGHCYDPLNNHDKVWGAIKLDYQKVIIFWGRRGKKLQTKITTDNWDLSKLISAKENKGYNSVAETHLYKIYPEFQSDLEKTAMWAILVN